VNEGKECFRTWNIFTHTLPHVFETVSWCLGCTRTHCVDLGGLTYRDQTASAFWVLGLKTYAIMPYKSYLKRNLQGMAVHVTEAGESFEFDAILVYGVSLRIARATQRNPACVSMYHEQAWRPEKAIGAPGTEIRTPPPLHAHTHKQTLSLPLSLYLCLYISVSLSHCLCLSVSLSLFLCLCLSVFLHSFLLSPLFQV